MPTMLADSIKPKLEAAKATAQKASIEAKAAREKFLAEGHDPADSTTDAWKQLDELFEAKQTAEAELAGLSDQMFKALKMDGVSTPGYEPTDPAARAKELPAVPADVIKAFAEQAIGSESYADLQAVAERVGSRSGWGGQRVLGAALGMDSFMALVTGAGDTSGGAFVQPDRKQYVPMAERALSIRNLVTVLPTSSDLVEYVRQTSQPSSAALVGEATSVTPGAEDGLKPEGSISFTVEQSAIKNIAEIVPVTRRAFADSATLQGIIENALRYDHVKKLEDEMIAGSGVGETHLLGLTNVISNAYDGNPLNDNDLAAVRKGITTIQVDNEDDPNGVLVNPVDAETQDLLRDASGGAGTGQYLSGSPWAAGPTTLWGLARIVTNAIPAGTAIVGNFRRATLHLRQGPEILASDSHKDWFARNIIALLCEGRYGFTVERPASFAVVTFDR
jgi:HK97 family phage major capsid protein